MYFLTPLIPSALLYGEPLLLVALPVFFPSQAHSPVAQDQAFPLQLAAAFVL